MSLDTVITAPADLGPRERAAMLRLMDAHFDGLEPATFRRDLEAKDWVILLRDGPEIGGFSTVQVLHAVFRGRSQRLLFSGDTIVAPEHRNRPALAGCFGHLILHELERCGAEPLHWLLISKGYRTYRFLPMNFKAFFPRFGQDTPEEIQALLDQVAQDQFGARFDRAAGLVRAAPGTDRLKPVLCAIPQGRAEDPHVRFFLERNPGFAAGDELVCLTPLTRDNLTAMGWRQIQRASPAWMLSPEAPGR